MILEAFAAEISIVSSAEGGPALLTPTFARLPAKLQDSFLRNPDKRVFPAMSAHHGALHQALSSAHSLHNLVKRERAQLGSEGVE